MKVCVSEGRVQVYYSSVNPNSALYSWMFEVKHEPQETVTLTCLSYFITDFTNTTATATPSRATPSLEGTRPSQTSATSKVTPSSEPTTSSEATTSTFAIDALTFTVYISVVGMEDNNSFVLYGSIGNCCHEVNTQCVQGDPTTNFPTTTSPDNSELLGHNSSAF